MTTDLRPLPYQANPEKLAALHDAARHRAAQLRAEAIADAAVWLMRSVVTPATAGATTERSSQTAASAIASARSCAARCRAAS